MKLKYLYPLIGFVVPTVVVGYGYVIPNSPIAGWNESTIGFAGSIVGACVTYVTGILIVLRDTKTSPG